MKNKMSLPAKFFLLLGIIMVIWPMVILIGGVFSFSGDVANTLSLGLIYKIQPVGFEELGGLCFLILFILGIFLLVGITEAYEKR
jgi:hypothetical protein